MKKREIIYNKLVRDKIPDVIKSKGDECVCKTINGRDYFNSLNEKLKEEVNEYLESKSVEELADIIEVIYAILNFQGLLISDLETLRINKLNKRGAFNERVFLEKVIKAG